MPSDSDALVGVARARAKYAGARKRQGLALCLSGGGWRAALFHLGALRRLNELGILAQVDSISTVSGGSLVAALLATHVSWPVNGVVGDWDDLVAEPARRLTATNIRTGPFLHNVRIWEQPGAAVKAIERRIEGAISGASMSLADLPKRPRFIFCATELGYAVNWESAKTRVGDYMAGYTSGAPAGWSVARAAAASACFPPVFDPLPIDLGTDQLTGGRSERYDAALSPARREVAERERAELIAGLRLSDGGVYDNLGLEPVWKGHATVLASDGGATLDFAPDKGFPRRLGRYLSVVENQAGAVRKRWLMDQFLDDRPTSLGGTYWGIGSATASYARGLPGYSAWLSKRVIAKVRTDLDAFSTAEQCVLENHGYLLADAAIRTHQPQLATALGAQAATPHPAWMDEERVERALADSAQRKLVRFRFRLPRIG